jgi:two-component sensor histidine kinase
MTTIALDTIPARGRFLLDLTTGVLLLAVAVLVYDAGATFALLLFVVTPLVAVVQRGLRRWLWLAVNLGICLALAVERDLPAGATALRIALVTAVAAAAVGLVRLAEREGARARRTSELAAEADHRIGNSLQAVADLLLLGRPGDGDSLAFDEASARIRSIAAVHRLLADSPGLVDAAVLLDGVAAAAPRPVVVEAEPLPLEAGQAQKLGIVANELIANAFRHGAPPVAVRLHAGEPVRLEVDDGGGGTASPGGGIGLPLVRRLVEAGLGGRFALGPRPGGGTRAEVVFPVGG